MTFTPAHLILQDMSEPQAASQKTTPISVADMPVRQPPVNEQAIADAVAAASSEAYERGRADGVAFASADYEKKLNDLLNEHEAKLSDMRQEMERDIGEQLWQRLSDELHALRELYTEQTAKVIVPFLGEEIRKKAVLELVASVSRLVTEDQTVKIEVTGKQALLDGFQVAMPKHILNVTYSATDETEIRIKANETVIESRISDWLRRMERALA